MTEKQLVDKILESRTLENRFGTRSIENIHREYPVGNNKYVDVAVETKDFIHLIEVKVDLISYDIGQILSYMVSLKPDTFKRIKGILLYNKISEKELKLLTGVIKDFNIDIELIEYRTRQTKKTKESIDT